MTIIHTTLPLPLEDMKQAITSPDSTIVINYAASKLKGRTALIYMTNANLPNPHFDVAGVPREEVFTLIDAYITQKSTVNNRNLVDSVIQIVYAARGIEVSPVDQQSIDRSALLTREDVKDYLADQQRLENIVKLIHVLDSLVVFVLYSNTAFKGTEGEDPSIPVINDIDYTGFTYVNLLEIESFMVSYFTLPPLTQPSYFKQQFEEYMYNGKNLFAYMSNTFMMPTVSSVLDGTITLDTLYLAVQESAVDDFQG